MCDEIRAGPRYESIDNLWSICLLNHNLVRAECDRMSRGFRNVARSDGAQPQAGQHTGNERIWDTAAISAASVCVVTVCNRFSSCRPSARKKHTSKLRTYPPNPHIALAVVISQIDRRCEFLASALNECQASRIVVLGRQHGHALSVD